MGTALLGVGRQEQGQGSNWAAMRSQQRPQPPPWSCKTGRVLLVAPPPEPWGQGDLANASFAAHTPGGSERRTWDPRDPGGARCPWTTFLPPHTCFSPLIHSFSISFDLKANDEHVSSGFLFTVSSGKLNNFSSISILHADKHP